MTRKELLKRLSTLEADLERANAHANQIAGAVVILKEILAATPEDVVEEQ